MAKIRMRRGEEPREPTPEDRAALKAQMDRLPAITARACAAENKIKRETNLVEASFAALGRLWKRFVR